MYRTCFVIVCTKRVCIAGVTVRPMLVTAYIADSCFGAVPVRTARRQAVALRLSRRTARPSAQLVTHFSTRCDEQVCMLQARGNGWLHSGVCKISQLYVSNDSQQHWVDYCCDIVAGTDHKIRCRTPLSTTSTEVT